ncbi:MAG TPA: hypothetical protein VEK76_09955 [Candidatus Binatia bacterium]|nr:hypothetical protein [Candidatus Binatia bacterium]
MTVPIEPAVSVDDDLLGEDWFGDGSAFDSGEQLAAALTALASGRPAASRAAPLVSARSLVSAPTPGRPASWPGTGAMEARRGGPPAGLGDTAAAGVVEFQVAAMPSSVLWDGERSAGRASAAFGWRGTAMPTQGAQRTGWSIRQSVQILRVTEDALLKLREEAAELAWRLADAAYQEIEG